MDIVRKSKNSESLCDHCRYAQDCAVCVSIGKYYDILSCAMGEELPSILSNINHYNPRKKKEKELLTTFTENNLKKIQDDFKKKSIDEKLNIIYGRLIGIPFDEVYKEDR